MEKTLRIGYLAILALMPVHAFITVWLISNIGYDSLVSAWKEILLALLFPVAAVLLARHPGVAKAIFNRRINQLILAFLALHLVLWAFTGIELDAASAGLLINLRFFAIFVLAQVLVARSSEMGARSLRSMAGRIVLAGGVLVSIFGALQLLVLPADVLSHFGYGPETIEPYRTIDQNEDYIRINSTLRGPNPLGLYMILALPVLFIAAGSKFSFLFSRLSIKKQRLQNLINGKWSTANGQWSIEIGKWLLSLAFLAGLITVYGSHSRTGWLGAAIALSLLVWLSLKPRIRRPLMWTGLILLLTTSFLLLMNRNTDFVQHTVLHQDPSGGTVVDSTAKHWQASGRAINDIADNPLGDGPGSAGPASFYNDEQTRIAENYFLQLGQEVGLLGIVLFIAINVLVWRYLWSQKEQIWPRLLLASFAGLTIANLFLHAWAQDEIALIWWGLAGLFYEE